VVRGHGAGAPAAQADEHTAGEHTAGGSIDTAHLTVLGQEWRRPVEHVECFAAPPGVTTVRFRTEELASLCPVTRQPDLSSVLIEYEPDAACIESKSLKLYLWSFRERAVFAEALAAEIAGEVLASARPHRVRVTLTQRPRGGITIEAVAELPAES
jgi:7-cyano-7-deazaguanine reductase